MNAMKKMKLNFPMVVLTRMLLLMMTTIMRSRLHGDENHCQTAGAILDT